jgi:hypothetical protein
MRRENPDRVDGEPSAVGIRPDPARLAAGWERRFVADPARAEEAVKLYAALGYEVCADPVRPEDLDEGCDACLLASHFKTIYTRRKAGA